MIVFWIVLGLALAVAITAIAGKTKSRRREPRAVNQTAAPIDQDPVQALLKHGVSEDYQRLLDQGLNLKGLGHRPPEDR